MKKKINHKTYVLLLIFVLTIFSFLITNVLVENTTKFIFTARISELTTTTIVRVRSVVYDIAVGCLQNSINLGGSISANISVTNKGSYQGDAQINWWVEDDQANPLNVSGSSTINVQPGYTWASIKTSSLPSISTGIYYFKFNISAPTYFETANCSFSVTRPTPITTPSSTGGSIGQPSVEKGTTSETVTVSKITGGEEGTFNYKSSDLSISKISVSVTNTVQDAKISVTTNYCGGEEGTLSSVSYQAMCIQKQNIENFDVKEVKIGFKVEKSWISKNEISLSSISLYRYANGWNELPTNIVNEDENNIYFEAKTFGLSTFVISGKKIGENKQVDISYPSSISAFINSTKKIYVQVKNREDKPLNNLKLILQGLELEWFRIIPTNIDLDPDTTQEFVIEFTIPSDAPIKTYPVNLIVKSDEFEEYVKADMNILEILPGEKIKEEVDKFEEKIANLEDTLDKLNERGIETVAAKRLLEVAKEKLNEVRSELQVENYGRASEILSDAEKLLNDIEETLSKSSFQSLRLNTILVGFVLVVVLSLFVGMMKLLFGGKIKMKKKRGIEILEKIKFMLLSKNCPKCHKRMQEMYRGSELIGYRCSRCGYVKYKSG